jgi:hypothetical protein
VFCIEASNVIYIFFFQWFLLVKQGSIISIHVSFSFVSPINFFGFLFLFSGFLSIY